MLSHTIQDFMATSHYAQSIFDCRLLETYRERQRERSCEKEMPHGKGIMRNIYDYGNVMCLTLWQFTMRK